MHFGFTDEQRDIQQSAKDLLASRCGMHDVRAHAEAASTDRALWDQIVALGWPGIAVPEDHGGAGLGLVELAILLEELGYALAPTPLLGTACAALVIDAAGSARQRERWLPRLAAGELVGAIGARELIPDGRDADLVIVVDAGVADVLGADQLTPHATIDRTRGYTRAPDDVCGERLVGAVAGGLARVQVALAAELLGVAQRALDLTVAYVKDRRQFGRPVGAFQAVAHRCADMLVATEAARSATAYAAWACDHAPALAPEAAAIAKAVASDAARDVTAGAIQAHGGVGFTWEADLHWLYKRAQLSGAHLGAGHAHRATLARIAVTRVRAAAVGAVP